MKHNYLFMVTFNVWIYSILKYRKHRFLVLLCSKDNMPVDMKTSPQVICKTEDPSRGHRDDFGVRTKKLALKMSRVVLFLTPEDVFKKISILEDVCGTVGL